jgi:hypothetical protein
MLFTTRDFDNYIAQIKRSKDNQELLKILMEVVELVENKTYKQAYDDGVKGAIKDYSTSFAEFLGLPTSESLTSEGKELRKLFQQIRNKHNNIVFVATKDFKHLPKRKWEIYLEKKIAFKTAKQIFKELDKIFKDLYHFGMDEDYCSMCYYTKLKKKYLKDDTWKI